MALAPRSGARTKVYMVLLGSKNQDSQGKSETETCPKFPFQYRIIQWRSNGRADGCCHPAVAV